MSLKKIGSKKTILSIAGVILFACAILITVSIVKRNQNIRSYASQPSDEPICLDSRRSFPTADKGISAEDMFVIMEEHGYLDSHTKMNSGDLDIIFLDLFKELAPDITEHALKVAEAIKARPYASIVVTADGKYFISDLYNMSGPEFRATTLQEAELIVNGIKDRALTKHYGPHIATSQDIMVRNIAVVDATKFTDAKKAIEELISISDTRLPQAFDFLAANKIDPQLLHARLSGFGTNIVEVRYYGDKVRTFQSLSEAGKWMGEFNTAVDGVLKFRVGSFRELALKTPLLLRTSQIAARVLKILEIADKFAWPLLIVDVLLMGDGHSIYFGCNIDRSAIIRIVYDESANNYRLESIGRTCETGSYCEYSGDKCAVCKKSSNITPTENPTPLQQYLACEYGFDSDGTCHIPTCQEKHPGSNSTCKLYSKCSTEVFNATGTTCEDSTGDTVCCGTNLVQDSRLATSIRTENESTTYFCQDNNIYAFDTTNLQDYPSFTCPTLSVCKQSGNTTYCECPHGTNSESTRCAPAPPNTGTGTTSFESSPQTCSAYGANYKTFCSGTELRESYENGSCTTTNNKVLDCGSITDPPLCRAISDLQGACCNYVGARCGGVNSQGSIPYGNGMGCGGKYEDVYNCTTNGTDYFYDFAPGDSAADETCNSESWCSGPLPTQSAQSVELACDFNSNGLYDSADYQIWIAELNGAQSTKLSDCDKDGDVDIYDFNKWLEYKMQ